MMMPMPIRRKGYLTTAGALGVPVFVLTAYLLYYQPLSRCPTRFSSSPTDHDRNRLGVMNPSLFDFLSSSVQINHSPDGHLYFNDDLHRSLNDTLPSSVHPIHQLIKNASHAWETKLASQSKDFKTAVSEYRRRNHRNPPKGYEHWWNWASENNVQLLDEYDTLQRSIQPFFALPPHVFKQRAIALTTDQTKWLNSIFVISIRNGQLSLSGRQANTGPRSREMVDLLKDIAHLLPDLDIPISMEDLPAVSVSASKYEQHIQAARTSTLLSVEDVEDVGDQPGFHGWPNMCPSHSELRLYIDGIQNVSRSSFSQSYIHDPVAASDFCNHPSLLSHNGFLSSTYPKVHTFFPLLSFSKLQGFGEIPLTPPSQFMKKVGEDPDWENKTGKLVWRGRTTGAPFSRMTNWRQSQRTRLVMFCNQPRGNVSIRTADPHGILKYSDADTKALNEKYFDVAFTSAPLQCDNTDGTCEALQKIYVFKSYAESAETNGFKYIMDVDGNGWSGRFHRLMSTKSAIMKSTIFPEWYADKIQPWLHYVPVRVDYQDLYDIMAFFLGDVNGQHDHDQLGKSIGQAGHDWSKEFWRLVDMQAYMYLLLLEYARLFNRDPDNLHSMDYF